MLQEGFLFFLYLYRMKVSFDFEQPLVDMEEQLDKLRQVADNSKVNVAASITELEQKLQKARNDIYSNLSGWQKVQLYRHPDRPYTLHRSAEHTSDLQSLMRTSHADFSLK